jgi:hypothetical protein
VKLFMSAPAPTAVFVAVPRRAEPWLLAAQVIMLILAGFLVYLPALHGQWLWDDRFILSDNPLMRDSAGWWKIWFAPPGPDYFPLTTTVEWLLWQFFGDHTFPFHVACLVLHLLSAFLLWRLFLRLGLKLAWWGALLFVVHPVMVESVAWISELKNTVSLPFLLGALLAWLNYDEQGRPRDYAAALALFLAALLAKTSVVMLPFVLLLHAWWKHGGLSRKKFLAALPFFAVAFILGLLTMFFQRHWAVGTDPVEVGGPVVGLVRAGWAILFYLDKCLWPFGLMPIYPTPDFAHPSPFQFAPWLLIVLFFGLLWSRRQSWGCPAMLGLGFFLLNLVPVLGFVSMSYLRIAWVADHFVYISAIGVIGLVIAVAEETLHALPRQRGLCMAVASALLLLLAWQSRAYAAVYRAQTALWAYNVRLNPDSWQVQLNLSLVLTEQGQRDEAAAAARQAIQLKPDEFGPHMALANVVAQQGNQAEAAREYAAALKYKADSIEAHVNYGIVLLRLGQAAESEHQYYLATLCPAQTPATQAQLAVAHFNLAQVMLKDGRRDDAIRHLEAALIAQPDLAQVRKLLEQLRALPPAPAK